RTAELGRHQNRARAAQFLRCVCVVAQFLRSTVWVSTRSQYARPLRVEGPFLAVDYANFINEHSFIKPTVEQSMPIPSDAWFLVEPKMPLVRRAVSLRDPQSTEAIIEVLANGVCHTDLGFADGLVRPNHSLPLVLGHEAVGRVVEAGSSVRHLLGKTVIVPAVLPCGECPLCRSWRGNACPHQKMPGNDIDGAFATPLLVPANPLVVVEERPGLDLRWLSVVADAVSTAFQATCRADVAPGDLAIVLGAGGVGSFV